MYALKNCFLHTGKETIGDRAVLIDGLTIRGVVDESQLSAEYEAIDLNGCHVAPGFIDLQLNGCGGVMFNDDITADTLEIMHRTNLKSGTTSFLPTLITTSDEEMRRSMSVVSEYRTLQPYRVLGLHLEGPYFNPKRKGIHNESYIRLPDAEMIDAIASAGKDVVRLLTLAPEMVDSSHIRQLADAGIVVSAGHTDASFEQAIAGFDAGVQMVTHLFNAMSPWQGRNPGVVGAAFSRADVYAGIIADGYHVHYESIRLAKQIKGDRLILVTDATPPAGTQMESFWIGGQQVFYQNGKCVSADGTLGGSALTMIEAIANCVHYVHIPLPEALRMASTYPAKLLGLDDKLGYVASGYIANLAIIDADLRVVGIVDRGKYLAGTGVAR